MRLEINGKGMDAKSVQNFRQELDMRNAAFSAIFDYGDVASVRYSYYSLRHLPFCVLMDVTIMRKKT